MIKFTKAEDNIMFNDADMAVHPATLESPRKSGFDYTIQNTFNPTGSNTLKFTYEQIVSMFSDPEFPIDPLIYVDANVMYHAHIIKMKHDERYKAIVEFESAKAIKAANKVALDKANEEIEKLKKQLEEAKKKPEVKVPAVKKAASKAVTAKKPVAKKETK